MVMLKDRRWYLSKKSEVHEALKEAVTITLAAERPRLMECARLLTLYREKKGTFGALGLNLPATISKLSRNMMRVIIKTAQSRLLALKPVPFYCSEGGDFDLRQQLEYLNEAVAGLFLASHFEDQYAALMILHGALFGTGHVKVFAKGKRVAIERVYPWEVFVDQLDGLYGEPRAMYQVRWVDRPVLYELYTGLHAREAIKNAPTDRAEWAGWTQGLGDPIRVTEAWYLPDEEGKGGRHVIALDNWTLRDEEYTHPEFPVVTFRYSDPEEGYWPDGIGHEVYGKQVEINKICDAIAETVRRCAWPRVYVEKAAQVSAAQLDNTIGAIVRYTGIAPQQVAAGPLTAEARQHLMDLVQSCFDDTGISQYAATSTKPAELQSGRALRIYADQQDGRLRDPGEKWTATRVAVGRAMIRTMRDIVKDHPDVEIIFTDPKKQQIKKIRWADADVPDHNLDLICQPVSSLPQTPAARAALLDELFNSGSGVITLEEYRDGLDLPDVEALTGPSKAPRRTIEKSLDIICKSGGEMFVPPEGFFPLEMALTMAAQRYCQAFNDDASEEVLAGIRRYIAAVQDLQKIAKGGAAAPPQEIPPEGMPAEGVPPEAMPPEGMAPPPQGEMLS